MFGAGAQHVPAPGRHASGSAGRHRHLVQQGGGLGHHLRRRRVGLRASRSPWRQRPACRRPRRGVLGLSAPAPDGPQPRGQRAEDGPQRALLRLRLPAGLGDWLPGRLQPYPVGAQTDQRDLHPVPPGELRNAAGRMLPGQRPGGPGPHTHIIPAGAELAQRNVIHRSVAFPCRAADFRWPHAPANRTREPQSAGRGCPSVFGGRSVPSGGVGDELYLVFVRSHRSLTSA